MSNDTKIKSAVPLKNEPGAYEIVNEQQEVVYVGSSSDLKRRYNEHRLMLKGNRHNNKKLQELTQTEQLTFAAMPCATKEEALDKEQDLLDHNRSNDALCNISINARAPIYERSQETKDKMSKWQTAIIRGPLSEETKQKISDTNKGRLFSQETRDKISSAHLGRSHSDEHRANNAKARKGKPLPQETKDKMSLAQKGRIITEEHRANLSKARTGMSFSEEAKANMVLGWEKRRLKYGK